MSRFIENIHDAKYLSGSNAKYFFSLPKGVWPSLKKKDLETVVVVEMGFMGGWGLGDQFSSGIQSLK